MSTLISQSLETFSAERVEQSLQAAAEAFPKWRTTSFEQRAGYLYKAAEILNAEAESLGRIVTEEMGKPISAAVEEVRKCARTCRFYAEKAEKFLAEETLEGPAAQNLIRYEPLGPVLAVMPWNFPLWQVFRFAAPALMAGNVGLLKHASNVPRCALAIEDILCRAGFPDGVFQTLLIPAKDVKSIIHDRRVRAVTLTGSVEAGRRVASEAGAALKKVVLELGGSDPFIIMPSADLDKAVSTAIKARTVNNGQSCIAAKRFFVAESIYDEVERKIVAGMQALVVGDPLESKTQIGPLATEAIADEVAEQVRDTVAAGAKLLTGGRRREGSFYEPTVLANIPADSRAYREEVFGPVALLFRVKDAEHALALANDTEFGLGASAWTTDPMEQRFFVERLDAGMVFINGMVASDPRLPFGGTKDSGYGRELGAFGIREFVNVKTVCVQPR
jgi:succinate-semialdehyde dehydrogenase/glutarate-semialdehyde dehydrogenase